MRHEGGRRRDFSLVHSADPIRISKNGLRTYGIHGGETPCFALIVVLCEDGVRVPRRRLHGHGNGQQRHYESGAHERKQEENERLAASGRRGNLISH